MSRLGNMWRRKPAGMVFGTDFSGGRLLSPDGKTVTLEGSASINAADNYMATTGAVTDQGTVADSSDLSFTDGAGTDRAFSVSCWVYLTALPSAGNRAGVIKKGTKQGSTTWEYDCWAQFQDTTIGPALAIRHSNAAASLLRYSPPLSAGQWYHLAFLYDGGEVIGGLKIYQGGVRVDATSGGAGAYTGMSDTATPLNLGTSSLGGTNPSLNGRTDDIRIFNYELTAAQVLRIFNEGRQ